MPDFEFTTEHMPDFEDCFPKTQSGQLEMFKRCITEHGMDIETACGLSGLPFGIARNEIDGAVEGDPLHPFQGLMHKAIAYRNAQLQDAMYRQATEGSVERTTTVDSDGQQSTREVVRPADAGMALKLMQQYKPREYNQAKVEARVDDDIPDVTGVTLAPAAGATSDGKPSAQDAQDAKESDGDAS